MSNSIPGIAPDGEIVLQTRSLRREYQMGRESIVALGGIDISIQKGEFVAIMGPSGSGKSTLLNLLGGLDQPTNGKVILDGHDLSEYNEEQLAAIRRQKMGFIFQRHDLFPVLTTRENIEFPMLLNEIPVEDQSFINESIKKSVFALESVVTDVNDILSIRKDFFQSKIEINLLKMFMSKMEEFLKMPEMLLLPQMQLLGAAHRNTVQKRAFNVIFLIYKQIYERVLDPATKTPDPAFENLERIFSKTPEQVAKILEV